MGKLEDFVAFAKSLPSEQRGDIEKLLEKVQSSYSQDSRLSPEQEAENRRRFADPNPEYADIEEVEKIFGRKFTR